MQYQTGILTSYLKRKNILYYFFYQNKFIWVKIALFLSTLLLLSILFSPTRFGREIVPDKNKNNFDSGFPWDALKAVCKTLCGLSLNLKWMTFCYICQGQRIFLCLILII